MYKYSFFNDYSEGAHPKILEALTTHNFDQEAGYSLDRFTKLTSEKIRQLIGDDKADIHLVTGGTQANQIVLASILKPYESVIAANSGHINVHEAGAIEVTGHKVNAIEAPQGKLTPALIAQVLAQHPDEHTVKPRVVFISNATEVGTIYQEAELKVLSEFCRSHMLYLYLDGARLGSGLMSEQSDLTIDKVAKYVDVFYIGGTKNGALLGEAIVIINDKLKPDFRYHLKQRGALLAKGRMLGIQFDTLFTDNLYFDLAKHANTMAAILAEAIAAQGYEFLSESSTNQIFPILPNQLIDKLMKMYGFYVWSKIDNDNSAIRLVTSWATTKEAVDGFIADLKNL